MRTGTHAGKIARALIAALAIVGVPVIAVADHVPDNLSQDLNPNYIACLAAVDDAETEFRDALQSSCLERMGDICSGKNGYAPAAQVIACLHFETQRGIEFLEGAIADLPATTDTGGLFEHGYQRRRDSILADVEELRTSPKPETSETAIQQSVAMASAAITLFWLARETRTSLQPHVLASFGDH